MRRYACFSACYGENAAISLYIPTQRLIVYGPTRRPRVKRFILTFLGIGLVCLGVASGSAGARGDVAAVSHEAGESANEELSPQEQNMLIGRYCFRCHNDALVTGGLSLESFDAANAGEHADVAEKMIRKLRAGMMPPPEAQRPDEATYQALISALETTTPGKPRLEGAIRLISGAR